MPTATEPIDILKHRGLVVSMALRRVGRGVDLDDLIQEGMIALWQARDRFEPERGFRFSTFAYYCIRNRLRGVLRDKSLPVLAPTHESGDSISLAELVAAKEVLEPQHDWDAVAPLLDRLPASRRLELVLRYGLDGRGARTLEEIGRLRRVSREAVQQSINSSLSMLRVMILKKGATT